MSTSGDKLFGSFFVRHSITGDTLNTSPLTGVRLKTSSNSKLRTLLGGHHSPTTRTGMSTSMHETATPHQSRRNQHAAPISSVPAAREPRATTTSFVSGITPLTLLVLVLPAPRLLPPPNPCCAPSSDYRCRYRW